MLPFLFGKTPQPTDIGIIVVFSVFGTAFAMWQLFYSGSDWPWWKLFLYAFIFLDILGGCIANMTQSTNSFYREHSTLSIVFLLGHIAQPMVLFGLGCELVPMLVTFALALVNGLILLRVGSVPYQKPLAMALAAVSTVLVLTTWQLGPPFSVLVPLYFMKLTVAFPVTHHVLNHQLLGNIFPVFIASEGPTTDQQDHQE
jgi:hypothetical protein